MAKDRYYAYCTYPGHEGRWARGFVLAPNLAEAMVKAKRRVNRERGNTAKWLGMRVEDLPRQGRTYRVRVWLDADRKGAPTAKHYAEKEKVAV